MKIFSFLLIYWLIFWQRFLRNPYLLSTSELASTYFPFWVKLGKKWSATDNYYKYPACIPFLSMFYLPNILTAWLASRLELDRAFRVFTWLILSHYLVGSLVAYWMFSQWASPLSALFGAITLTYAGYCIKPQTPAFVYTMCWMSGMLLTGWKGALCLFMALAGGYYPILIYFLPLAAIINPVCLWGLLPGLIQLIPFLWYWKKSIRSGQKVDPNFGKLPWWKLIDLFWPNKSVALVNGVHYPEAEMYMGIAIIFSLNQTALYPFLCCIVLILLGLIPPIQRIPVRILYLLTFLLTYGTVQKIHQLPYYFLTIITILQSFFLLRNSEIYPSFPFSQWWDKPKKLYLKSYAQDKWPFFTGYLWEGKTSGYHGGFALRD